MAAQKKYFHDHFVLLLLSLTAFVAIASSLYLGLSLLNQHSATFIVQCRDCSNIKAVDRFVNGSQANLLSLSVFAMLVAAANFVLSLRLYRIHRQLAIGVLSLGLLLLVLNFIIGEALLGLR